MKIWLPESEFVRVQGLEATFMSNLSFGVNDVK